MGIGVENAAWLLALPLACLPFITYAERATPYPAVAFLPEDPWSERLLFALRLAGALAITGVILGLAGLHWQQREVTRAGEGAHIVLLLDRSSSMDSDFAGKSPEGGQESKGRTAQRLLKQFVARRSHDLIGVSSFSTAALYVLPLTDHHDAVAGAIDTMATRGMSLTNVAKGLNLALDQFGTQPKAASRVVMLVSDGAALIDAKSQQILRKRFGDQDAKLYWLFLHTEGDRGPLDEPESAREDNARAMPERYLHQYFSSLNVEYRVYDAASPDQVAAALHEIERLERQPMLITERLPRSDLAGLCYGIAVVALLLLLTAKLFEVQPWRTA
jgi:mxaC protein